MPSTAGTLAPMAFWEVAPQQLGAGLPEAAQQAGSPYAQPNVPQCAQRPIPQATGYETSAFCWLWACKGVSSVPARVPQRG